MLLFANRLLIVNRSGKLLAGSLNPRQAGANLRPVNTHHGPVGVRCKHKSRDLQKLLQRPHNPDNAI
jgi:hypothetical protein